MSFLLAGERVQLREMTQDDTEDLRKILQDPIVMHYYEGAFTDQEVDTWLNTQLCRYKDCGFGLWAVTLKETGEMIGQCGLTIQAWKKQTYIEVGYLFNKDFWHNGYAAESAELCLEYAFTVLNRKEVVSIIRDNNEPSKAVALRNGLTQKDDGYTKFYKGVHMPHVLFSAIKEPWLKKLTAKRRKPYVFKI